MPQPGVIIEWYGPHLREEIGNEVAEAGAGHWLGMVLQEGNCRYLTSWDGTLPEDPANAAVRLLADADNGQFYIGQIISFGPAAGRRAAMWALTRALHPGLNLEGPSENPPDGKHCVTVFSTFWLWDETEQDYRLVGPPAGFPTLVLFNSYGHAEEPVVEMELWQSHFRQIS